MLEDKKRFGYGHPPLLIFKDEGFFIILKEGN
jgi:hypothetical protein